MELKLLHGSTVAQSCQGSVAVRPQRTAAGADLAMPPPGVGALLPIPASHPPAGSPRPSPAAWSASPPLGPHAASEMRGVEVRAHWLRWRRPPTVLRGSRAGPAHRRALPKSAGGSSLVRVRVRVLLLRCCHLPGIHMRALRWARPRVRGTEHDACWCFFFLSPSNQMLGSGFADREMFSTQ